MRPRLVDWTLYGLTAIAALTGLGAWLVTDLYSRATLTAHAVAGFALLVPLAWKLRRVRLRLVRLKAWDARTPISALTAVAALVAIGSGAFWTHAQWPTGYPNGMHIHIVAGLALCGLLGAHVLLRFKRPARHDFSGRRDALRWLGMLSFGGALLPAKEALNRVFHLPGAQRRFTGSRHAGSDSGNAFPITNWLFDRPTLIDSSHWRLTVHGATARAVAQLR